MNCQRCGSARLLSFSGKCSDMYFASCEADGYEHEGYVEGILDDGWGDYLGGKLCLECGQLQGKFPRQAEDPKED